MSRLIGGQLLVSTEDKDAERVRSTIEKGLHGLVKFLSGKGISMDDPMIDAYTFEDEDA